MLSWDGFKVLLRIRHQPVANVKTCGEIYYKPKDLRHLLCRGGNVVGDYGRGERRGGGICEGLRIISSSVLVDVVIGVEIGGVGIIMQKIITAGDSIEIEGGFKLGAGVVVGNKIVTEVIGVGPVMVPNL